MLDQNVDFFRILSNSDVLVEQCALQKYKYGDEVMNEYNVFEFINYIMNQNYKNNL